MRNKSLDISSPKPEKPKMPYDLITTLNSKLKEKDRQILKLSIQVKKLKFQLTKMTNDYVLEKASENDENFANHLNTLKKGE